MLLWPCLCEHSFSPEGVPWGSQLASFSTHYSILPEGARLARPLHEKAFCTMCSWSHFMSERWAPVPACGSRGLLCFLQLSSQHRRGGTGLVYERWPPSLTDQDPDGSKGPDCSLPSALSGSPRKVCLALCVGSSLNASSFSGIAQWRGGGQCLAP